MLKKLIRNILLGVVVMFGLELVTFLFAEESELQREINRQRKISQEKGWTGKDVHSLIKELRERKDGTKERVITHLGRLKDPRAIEPLAEVMLNSSDSRERNYAARQLATFENKKIVPIFKKQVLENGPHKILGAKVLMKLGNKKEKAIALPILEKYAEEGHPEVLSYSIKIGYDEKKGEIHKRKYYNQKKARKILKKILLHENEEVCAKGIYYLYEMGEKDLVKSKIDGMAKSKNQRVRSIIKEILKQSGDKESMRKLREIEREEKEETIKKTKGKKK